MKVLFRKSRKIFYIRHMYWSLRDWKTKLPIMKMIYFDRYERVEDENPTIGILLCKQSDEALVDLTLPQNANIYAKEYKLYLPDKKLLQKKLKEWLDEEQKNNL